MPRQGGQESQRKSSAARKRGGKSSHSRNRSSRNRGDANPRSAGSLQAGISGSNSGGNARSDASTRTARNARSKRRLVYSPKKEVPTKGDHILFVGFMGCGKSSVSRVLHKRTDIPLIDIDKYIEKTQGRRIKQIFAEEGEAGFRLIETQALAALAQEPRSIISCGGGICGSIVNRAIVKALGTVIYLQVPCDEAVGRISDPSTRPMLNGERPVQDIYDERIPLYESVADIIIDTSGKSVGQNTQQVYITLKRRGII